MRWKSAAQYHIISTLDDIAWILNVRGNDIPHVPVVLSFLVIGKEDAMWFVEENALSDAVKEMAAECGVGTIVDAAATVESWDKIVELAEKYSFIYGSVGVHPDEVGALNEENFARMRELLKKEKIVAVGEIGLDYYWDKEGHDLQKHWFIRQLDLAREMNKPVMIHSREAAADTMEIMKEHGKGLKGVIHCYSYSLEMAREYVKMGYYIGVGGVVTFKNSKKLKEIVEEIPLESIVLETDCPYLAPTPFRGKRNSSLYLPYVVEAIAELKGISAEQVIEQTEKNARNLYQL